MITYKNYIIEPDNNAYNLYKTVEYEKQQGLGKNSPKTGEIGEKKVELGFGMTLDRCIYKIVQDSNEEFTGELKDFVNVLKESYQEIKDYLQS